MRRVKVSFDALSESRYKRRMSSPLIVASLKDEIRIFKSKMVIDMVLHLKPPILHRGRYESKDLDLLVTGVGVKRMEDGLCKSLQHTVPSYLLYVGYAGGTSPVAGLGSLILGEGICYAGKPEVFRSDAGLLQKAEALCREKGFSFQKGNLVTVDRVIGDPHHKADIGAMHGSVALDMEAAALAQFGTERKIPFLTVKAILDPMEMKLPDLAQCIDEDGDTELGKVWDHFVQRPKDLMQLPKMQYHALQARNALTGFLESWMML